MLTLLATAALSAQSTPDFTVSLACEGPRLAGFVRVMSSIELPAHLMEAGRQDAVDTFLLINGDRHALRPLGQGRFRLTDAGRVATSLSPDVYDLSPGRRALEGAELTLDRSSPKFTDARLSIPNSLDGCMR
mgnify:CR=1 FL=1